jgi:hypothetical protein
MRYFRVTANPLDPYCPQGKVTLRLPLRFTGQMFYSEFSDGAYVRVPDQEMGQVGEILDVVSLGLDGPMEPYKMFQESGLPLGVLESAIPLWSAMVMPLWQPGDQAPEPQASTWAALGVEVNPVPDP